MHVNILEVRETKLKKDNDKKNNNARGRLWTQITLTNIFKILEALEAVYRITKCLSILCTSFFPKS